MIASKVEVSYSTTQLVAKTVLSFSLAYTHITPSLPLSLSPSLLLLQVILSKDEVDFIQNLVYYIERAYRTPDFGMWERGTNQDGGNLELHAR